MSEKELTQLMGTFCKRFLQRTDAYSLLEMGEDSVRYDFFLAIIEVFGRGSYKILLEKAIAQGAINLNNTEGSKRTEKPKLDISLSVMTLLVQKRFTVCSNEECVVVCN